MPYSQCKQKLHEHAQYTHYAEIDVCVLVEFDEVQDIQVTINSEGLHSDIQQSVASGVMKAVEIWHIRMSNHISRITVRITNLKEHPAQTSMDDIVVVTATAVLKCVLEQAQVNDLVSESQYQMLKSRVLVKFDAKGKPFVTWQ